MLRFVLGGPIVRGVISLVTLVFVWIGTEVGAGETRAFDSAIFWRFANRATLPDQSGRTRCSWRCLT